MPAFPTLSTGTVAFYPVTEAYRFNTGLVRFLDDTEQRYRKQARLAVLQIVWNNLSYADMQTVLGVFNGLKGGFDTTLSITLGATTYSNLCFVEDSLGIVQTKPFYYSIRANFRQVHG